MHLHLPSRHSIVNSLAFHELSMKRTACNNSDIESANKRLRIQSMGIVCRSNVTRQRRLAKTRRVPTQDLAGGNMLDGERTRGVRWVRDNPGAGHAVGCRLHLKCYGEIYTVSTVFAKNCWVKCEAIVIRLKITNPLRESLESPDAC